MIGTFLGLDLPSLTDPLATIVSKTVTALSAIQDSIADQATPAALNMNAALSMGGNAVTNASSLLLAAGTAPTAPGSFYYHAGEFYLIDATGAIRVTSNGTLDAAGVGGIGGDYGGINPALVYYDTASGEYRFYTNGGTHAFANLSAHELILNGASGTVTLLVDSSVVTNKTYAIGNLSTNQAVIFDGTKLVTGNTVTSTWTASDLHHTSFWEYAIPLFPTMKQSGGIIPTGSPWVYPVASGSFDFISVPLVGPKNGDTVTSITLNTQGAGTVTWRLYEVATDGTTSVAAADVTAGTGDTTFTGGGLPYTTAVGKQYLLYFEFSANAGELRSCRVTVTY
jgi:hypothetical protein